MARVECARSQTLWRGREAGCPLSVDGVCFRLCASSNAIAVRIIHVRLPGVSSMLKKIKLQDLLFVDHRRLNHYAEIIVGSPTIIEKGRKFGVKFSITSIEVSAEQPETRRQRTALENMATVRSYLEDHEELYKARPGKVSLDCLFVFEQCSLHKVEVPKIADGPDGAPKLTFWLSPAHERAQGKPSLCLLEDFSKSDGEVNSL